MFWESLQLWSAMGSGMSWQSCERCSSPDEASDWRQSLMLHLGKMYGVRHACLRWLSAYQLRCCRSFTRWGATKPEPLLASGLDRHVFSFSGQLMSMHCCKLYKGINSHRM